MGSFVARKPKKLWKVGELIRHTGLSRQTIHNYVVLGLIEEEEQTPSGHRLFGDSVFTRLDRIRRLKAKGLRLAEIAERLDRRAAPSAQDTSSEAKQTKND